MSELGQYYTEDVHANLRYFATWFPISPIELGDFGYLRGDLFERKSNLKYRGVTLKPNAQPSATGNFEYKSKQTTLVMTNAGAKSQVPGNVGNASVEFRFAKEKSIYFAATGCTEEFVEDEIRLGDDLVRLFEQERWNDDWVVVTRVIRAKNSTIIAANAAGASIKLDAEADVPQINLLSADLNLHIAGEHAIGFKAVTERNLTPLFQLAQVRDRLFGNPEFQTRHLLDSPAQRRDSFETLHELKSSGKNAASRFGLFKL